MVAVTYEHLDSFTKRNIMFALVFVFFATLGSIWGPFHIPAKQFYSSGPSSSVSSSALSLSLLYTVPFMYVRYYFFVTLKASFVQLQVCIFLTNDCQVLNICWFSLAKTHLLLPQTSTPLCHILHLQLSKPLLYITSVTLES